MGAARGVTTGATGTEAAATMGAAAMPLKFLATTWLLVAVTTARAGAAAKTAVGAASGACSRPGLATVQAIRAQTTVIWTVSRKNA